MNSFFEKNKKILYNNNRKDENIITITEKTIVSFNPIKEHEAMINWIETNNMDEWTRYENTVAYIFVKEKTTFFEPKVE